MHVVVDVVLTGVVCNFWVLFWWVKICFLFFNCLLQVMHIKYLFIMYFG